MTYEQVLKMISTNNLEKFSIADRKLIQTWRQYGASDERIAELLVYEM